MNTNTKFVAGILLGAAAGASLALLLSGEKGKELLSTVKDYAEKATDEVTNLFNKTKDAVEENAQNLSDVTA
jgi:gas vesicle protein